MDGKTIERLIELIERLGKAILERPGRLEELLLESCPGCEGEISGLVTALREGSLEHFLEGLNDPARERLVKGLSRLLQTVSTGEEPLQILTANGDELVFVKGGSFVMGELEGSESPAHRVNLTYDLYVGKYPVTFQEYDRYCDAIDYSGPDDDGIGRGRRPVVNLAWLQVIDWAVNIQADYVGFECPDYFVVGYGMDVAHSYRQLPYVGVVETDDQAGLPGI